MFYSNIWLTLTFAPFTLLKFENRFESKSLMTVFLSSDSRKYLRNKNNWNKTKVGAKNLIEFDNRWKFVFFSLRKVSKLVHSLRLTILRNYREIQSLYFEFDLEKFQATPKPQLSNEKKLWKPDHKNQSEWETLIGSQYVLNAQIYFYIRRPFSHTPYSI